ncbi:Sel1-like repeat-containing protein kinase family protein [Arcobacter roscoffensis]|uniref:beta-lactamase n=1 Tax=Arcobacter roscoffensis TaxID=2961520 RepID=A0ABY5E3H8_9BACT|nr:Sel1-like repeat-containing protein kinase family protein [Arcobacter roscoffensis]UTJ06300.1 Sel1-like repeat-containing protein kinase family protein [Arcobacter roscoffensis]
MKVDNYNIVKQIAKGAFSDIYLAKKDKKFYVIKKIPKYIDNFNKIQNEISSLKIMNNYKNSIKFYEAKKHDDFIYFVFDYVKGGDLHYQVMNKYKFSPEEIENFIFDILEQIEFIFKHQRLHNDITPFNILKKNNKFFLIDWGISNSANINSSVLHKGHKIYTAPEVYAGSRGLHSEIYSLGCCLYFLLTKNTIYNLKDEDSLIKKIYNHEFIFPNISKIKDEKYRYLVLRMLEKDYRKRASINEIKEILNKDFIVPKNYKYICKYFQKKIEEVNDFELCKELAPINYQANETLALFYEDGVFTKQDMVKSYLTYKKTAFKEYIPSISSLGVLYFKGKGVKKNYEKAYEFFIKSKDFPKSQYFIALMLEKNLCKDKNDYIYWYKLAAFNGFELAVNKLVYLKIPIEFESFSLED